MPFCVDQGYTGEPCPMQGVELFPGNFPAWEAYQHVGNIVQSALGGFPPLEVSGVLATLKWLGLNPRGPEERADLLRGLQIIHNARAEAHEAENKDGQEH